jgi:hypothetical protein
MFGASGATGGAMSSGGWMSGGGGSSSVMISGGGGMHIESGGPINSPIKDAMQKATPKL